MSSPSRVVVITTLPTRKLHDMIERYESLPTRSQVVLDRVATALYERARELGQVAKRRRGLAMKSATSKRRAKSA